MALIYAGIDEAGYGPMLGPMCVGRCVVRVEDWAIGSACPDLWALLSGAVARERTDRLGRIPVADSKRLKLANQVKTRHPLVHLERGVLCAVGAMGWTPATESELLDTLDVDLGAEVWRDGDGTDPALPLGSDAGLLAIDAGKLRDAMHGAGVSVLDLAVEAIAAPRFNAMLADAGSKAGLSGAALASQLGAIAAVHGRCADEPDTHLRVVADRLGARRRYGALLSSVWGVPAAPIEESEDASRYAVGERAAVLFRSEAEDAHWPVALASMAAKLVRELAMARFNRYWSGRLPELKPTAGYVQDARRWLRDAAPVLSDADRVAMIRRA